jgi:predicted AAA+ superfamily ATPase
MKRSIEKDLLEWKNKPDRAPLLVRGARQIGKTYVVEQFGREQFESILTINFEESKETRKAFDGDLNPGLIIRDLSARFRQPITPGKTLLFFDEIQACPNALLSLRFFKEQMPELHVIGAGSLLEFILGDGRFSFPVGRAEYFYMRPMSFTEFLMAKGETLAQSWLEEALPNEVGAATHASLLRSVKEYFIVGGMPAAVSIFLKTGQFLDLDAVHQNILNAYESDLGKYPKNSQQKFMRLLFETAPRLVADHFKYAKIHPHAQSRDYLESLDVLTRTGILHQVFANSASGVPLTVQKNEKKFKLLFLDIGLLPQPHVSIIDAEDLILVNRGKLAEQFVGQELIAYHRPYQRGSLYYWEREKKGSDAEVDYVIEVGEHVVPIEVKAGEAGSLRSLRQFMTEKKAPLGLRISQAPLSLDGDILSVPFYLIQEIPRLCTAISLKK